MKWTPSRLGDDLFVQDQNNTQKEIIESEL